MTGSAIVLAAIARETALLTRIVTTPVEPFGYGVDTSGTTALADTLEEVDPYSSAAISQALARRLQTPRGTLRDDLDYGRDLRAYVNRGMPVSQLREVEGEILGEVLKDDRVGSATVAATLPTLSSMKVEIVVTPEDPRTGGPFSLTLGVTSAAVLLEAVNANA